MFDILIYSFYNRSIVAFYFRVKWLIMAGISMNATNSLHGKYTAAGAGTRPEKSVSGNCSNELGEPRVRHKPWLKSTGPRTPEGKARSSMNSQKAGVWSPGFRRCLKEQCVSARGCYFRSNPDAWDSVKVGDPCLHEIWLDTNYRKDLLDGYPHLKCNPEYGALVEKIIWADILSNRAATAVARVDYGALLAPRTYQEHGVEYQRYEESLYSQLHARFMFRRLRLYKQIVAMQRAYSDWHSMFKKA